MTPPPAHPPASIYVAGPFSMGYVDFYTFLIPLYGLSLGLDASEVGILVRGRSILALFLSIHIGVLMDHFGTRKVTLFFCLDGDGPGALVSAGPRVLDLTAAAIGQRCRRLLRLVGRADPDCPARRRRCRTYRQIQLFRAVRLDDGADPRGSGVGLWRSLAGLSPRCPVGRGVDDRVGAHAGGPRSLGRDRATAGDRRGSVRAMSCRERRTISARLC